MSSHGPPPFKRAKLSDGTSKPKSCLDKKAHTGFARIEKYSNLNLPDGTHRRKLEKIKNSLIHKAKLTKQFHKIKDSTRAEIEAGKRRFQEQIEFEERERREEEERERRNKAREIQSRDVEGGDAEVCERIGNDGNDNDSVELSENVGGLYHERRRWSNNEDGEEGEDRGHNGDGKDQGPGVDKKHRKPLKKVSRFAKEQTQFERIKAEKEAHRQVMIEQEEEKERWKQEREKWKKAATAKTRTGQVKLGKQSGMLLEKIKRQMTT